MEIYIACFLAITGGFAALLFVSEIIYKILVFVVKKLDERDKANGKL